MDISDIRDNARFYNKEFTEKFYIVTTYNDTSFIIIGENLNFPHLMAISKRIYTSNGYRTASKLYNDILLNNSIPTAIVPNNISNTSKMYKKARNFKNATELFWKNACPIVIDYDPAKSKKNLNNVDRLIIDAQSGYMLGCKDNKTIQISSNILFKKFCISTWMDENGNNCIQKEKYMPNQNVEIIQTVLALDKNSNLDRPVKKYSLTKDTKIDLLKSLERNNANLLINSRNENNYVSLAQKNNIHCMINGIQY